MKYFVILAALLTCALASASDQQDQRYIYASRNQGAAIQELRSQLASANMSAKQILSKPDNITSVCLNLGLLQAQITMIESTFRHDNDFVVFRDKNHIKMLLEILSQDDFGLSRNLVSANIFCLTQDDRKDDVLAYAKNAQILIDDLRRALLAIETLSAHK